MKGENMASLDKYIPSQTECPVCGLWFGSGVIAEHANSCINSAKQNDKRKRPNSDWDFMSATSQKRGNIADKATKTGKCFPCNGRSKAGNTLLKVGYLKTFSSQDGNGGTVDCEKIPKHLGHSEREGECQTNNSSECKINTCNGGHKSSSNSSFSKDTSSWSHVPLAERVRPQILHDFVGQEQAVGRNSILYTLIMHTTNIPSIILWGPPGCGKTTLAKIIAQKCKEEGSAKFITMSATSASVSDVKEAAQIARNDLKMFRRKTILFLDEIHRFNKIQQDVLLPHVEDGTVTLIGATTENPSFCVNGALLSRCRVITLEKLTLDDIKTIVKHALPYMGIYLREEDCGDKQQAKEMDPQIVPNRLVMQTTALEALARLVDGDARSALNGLQMAVEGSLAIQKHQQTETNGVSTEIHITVDVIKEALQRTHLLYDKTGEEHYNLISALIKSLRGSDASASLYWMTRILEGGENPLFIARRLVIFASEDVGLAEPRGLTMAVSAHQACQVIGMPECALNLAQCVIYLARAPKSNEVLLALQAAKNCVMSHAGVLPPVPLHLRNAPTRLMKSLGYGKDYKYPHDFVDPVEQEYFPPSLIGTDFFSKPVTNQP